MSLAPFEIIRWDAPKEPNLGFLMNMMLRDGLKAEPLELAAKTHSPEVKYPQTAVRVLVEGTIQYSFPGYGVIELEPGDMLEIQPGVLHDVTVSSSRPAVLLQAFRE